MTTRTVPRFAGALDAWARDFRYAVRTLRAAPGFALVAIAILALGIGAATAIFSVASAVLLKPLPFVEPDRLVLLWENFTAANGPDRVQPAAATAVQWKARSRSFESLAMFTPATYNLTGDGEPERLAAVRTDTNLFTTLGLRPVLGRTFVPEDEGPTAAPVVVISERLWARRFAGDPALIGRTIRIDGVARTVIGVVPSDFSYPNADTSVWVPAAYSPEELANPSAYNYYVLGRLAPGVGLAAAQAELDAIASAMQSERPGGGGVYRFTVTQLQEHLSRAARPTLYTLLAAVGAILLITCANIANLLLARGTQRAKELAIRKAVGAGAGRVLRQLLAESAVLAAAGTALGLGLSTLAFEYLARLIPQAFPVGSGPGIDWRVLAFAVAVTAVTALAFGTGPASAAARGGFVAALKTGAATGARRSNRARHALVVTEIALTVVLLAATGLLLRSYVAVLAVDPGFRADHLLIAETPLAPSKYSALDARTDFYGRVLERVRALPGVEAAGYVNLAPLVFKGGRAYVSIEGEPPPTQADFARSIVADRVAGEGYLETLGVPLVRGRLFDSRDGADGPPAIVINETMARRFWPDQDPIGRRIKIGAIQVPNPWLTVVGVVGDVRQMGLDTEPEPEFFVSAGQPILEAPFFWPGQLLVRTRVEPLTLADEVRDAVWQVDADQPVASIRSMKDVVDAELTDRNTQLALVGAVAGLALLLAGIGLYGVLAYTVGQRTREIGLRMALGAEPAAVVRAVVAGALALAGAGIGIGLAAAFGLTRLLASFLYEVRPTDPLTAVATAAAILAVALLAAWVPAWRAARIAPTVALRDE